MKSALLVAALLAGQLSPRGIDNPLTSRAKEKQEFIDKLKRDIFKVDRSIGETDKLIAKSRNAPYLPDLQFRLAELYVEKSRYIYYLQSEQRPEGQKGALVSPETKLLKQKAVQIYNRILRENADFKDGDKVTFYLAHEQRELGDFDSLLKTLGELIRKYPSSPLRLEAEQIIGDYFFDKADLKTAEEHYRAVLDAPASPVHDLARYKMGWVRINQNNHADAVNFFEAAAASSPLPEQDEKKALNIKREALLDLVYSYTEARPAKGALQYFEKLSESRATYALALDKLGNRYFIKSQYEFAIPALRRLMEIQPDPELEYERVGKLYDSLKAAKGKVLPRPEDLSFLVRSAVDIKTDPSKDEATRKKQLLEIEEMARDLTTSLHTAAQKREDKSLYLDAAAAYARYLSLFRPKQYVTVMMQNRADALFAAKAYPAAARQFEELALYLNGEGPKATKESTAVTDAKDALVPTGKDGKPKDSRLAAVAQVSRAQAQTTLTDKKDHAEALYGALLSHYSSLKPGDVERLNAFEVADARQALKLLGAQYLSKYATSEHALEVKFNIARAYFEDGEYPKAAALFKEFAITHPAHKDATIAANLALDALRQTNDFKGIEDAGKAFLGSKLPATFLADVKRLLTEAKSDALGELALKSTEETGDVIEGLLKVADENRGQEIGEKGLYGAFSAAREKRDLKREQDIGRRFIAEYPKSALVSDVLLTLGRHAAEAGRFQDAAAWFEQVGQRFGGDATGLDGFIASARLKQALGDNAGAIKALESAADVAGARKAEVLVLIAQARMKSKEWPKARATAEAALKIDRENAAAAAIVAEVQATLSPNEKPDTLIATLTAVTNSQNGAGEDTARALWFLGEILFKAFKAVPNDRVEEKVAKLQELQGIYNQAASMGAAEWAVASLWRIALGLKHIVDVVEATPVPPGMAAAEVDAFRKAVKAQVEPLRQQSDNAFGACLNRAESLEVFSTAVLGCRKKTEDVASPLKAAPPARAVAVEELQKKAEATQDAASFEALGLAYLAASQMALATVNFNRAIEIDDARAAAHNGLGLALLYSGDPMGARAEYGRALEVDPTFEKARANVAALMCKFGNTDGAKRELALLKDAGALSTADVDPDWRACK